MVIKITHLPVGIHDISFTEPVSDYQLGESFVDNLILDCKLDKSQHQIVLKCNLTNFIKFNCDRCNDEFVEEINSEFTILYLYDKNSDFGDESNIHYLSPNDDIIDLTDDVIDFAKLSVPMKHLCDENCKGLCINCGTNLNHKTCNCNSDDVNPVWEPLLKLKDKLN